jgi:hypothetical protein
MMNEVRMHGWTGRAHAMAACPIVVPHAAPEPSTPLCLAMTLLTQQVSFQMSEYTADVDGIGALRLLNAVRACGLEKHTRLYQVDEWLT